jgi:hypothetical protein
MKNGHLVLIQNTYLEGIRQILIWEPSKRLKKVLKLTMFDS